MPAVEAQSAPGRPASVTVTRNGSTLTATWDAPAGATKYHVTYSADNGKSWAAAAGPDDGHSAATIDITGIDTGKSYIVGVRAGNEHGWSGWRNSAPNHPDGPPARPDYVSINRDDGAITASWNSIPGADKYHVTYSSDGKQSWSLAAAAHTSTSIAINVENQHAYVVGVRAGKSSGNDTLWGNWRNSPSSAPWVPADPPPSAPASVSLSRGCNQFSVSWSSVSGATGYDVNVSTNNRKSWKRALSNVTYTSWNFGKWNKNKTYTLAVRARNAAGESGWTNSAAAPPPPCEVGNLRAVTGTTHGTAGGSITASWDAAERASAYNVNYRADGGEWQRSASDVTATTHTGTVTATGGYTVAVQSTGGGAMSQWRNAGVSWLTADSITATGATLTLAGHSGDWYVKKTAPTPAGTCSSAITGATHDLTTLSAEQRYTYAAYSDSSCATEIGSATFSTSAAVALTASGVKVSAATLTIANHSGNWYYKANTGPDNTCSSSAITGTTKTLTGLTAGTEYTYSAYSDSSCATLLATADAFTTATGVSVSNLSETSDGTGVSVVATNTEANGFTTGDHGGGYSLDRVVIKLRDAVGNPGSFTAAIHAVSGGNPAASATYTLSGNTTQTTAGDYAYTCSGTCSLDKDTTYFLVLSGTSTSHSIGYYSWDTTASASETNTPSNAGWSIANRAKYKSGNTWNDEATLFSGMFQVIATEK